MNSRRKFIRLSLTGLSGLGLFFNPLWAFLRKAYADIKRIIVPKGTKMKDLIKEDPAKLDARNLDIIPLQDFDTMGVTDHKVNLQQWRLKVSGKVNKPLALSYAQVITLPEIERKILMICPGFFANHGQWKGISIAKLLEMAEAEQGLTHVTLRGPDGEQEQADRFPIADIRSNRVFLAYEVNGKILPQKHGFPLRAVAEDYYGSHWTKYVYAVEAE
jgi:sulfoxide reductase catalytic subunit YedY